MSVTLRLQSNDPGSNPYPEGTGTSVRVIISEWAVSYSNTQANLCLKLQSLRSSPAGRPEISDMKLARSIKDLRACSSRRRKVKMSERSSMDVVVNSCDSGKGTCEVSAVFGGQDIPGSQP
jgi:hypothetical protein